MNAMKKRKAPGWYQSWIVACQSHEWLTEWCKSVLIPLHKKVYTELRTNYRIIPLISHSTKGMLQTLNNRIKMYLHWQIPLKRARFVPGRGTNLIRSFSSETGGAPRMHIISTVIQYLWWAYHSQGSRAWNWWYIHCRKKNL